MISMSVFTVSTLSAILIITLVPKDVHLLTRNFTKRNVWEGSVRKDVNMLFIMCNNQDDAEQRARTKGGGAAPDLHPPHREGDPDHYWHYHPSNHKLAFENNEWNNYHYQFEGQPRNAEFEKRNYYIQRSLSRSRGRRSRSRSRSRSPSSDSDCESDGSDTDSSSRSWSAASECSSASGRSDWSCDSDY